MLAMERLDVGLIDGTQLGTYWSRTEACLTSFDRMTKKKTKKNKTIYQEGYSTLQQGRSTSFMAVCQASPLFKKGHGVPFSAGYFSV
jgi:hypothetical protein